MRKKSPYSGKGYHLACEWLKIEGSNKFSQCLQ